MCGTMATLKECRNLIRTLWKEGVHKVTTLQKMTGFPSKTLYRWAKQLEETNDLEQRTRSGCPKRLTPRKRRYLSRVAKSQRAASSIEITETLKNTYPDLEIAPRTVRENLQKLGYKVCIPRPVPILTEAAMKHRVSWAKAHQRQGWSKVVFSDETTFQMFHNTTQVYKSGEPRPCRATKKHPFRVHAWGAFCAKLKELWVFTCLLKI